MANKKEGRYSTIIGKKCFYGLAGKSNEPHFLGCNRKNAIKEAENLANQKKTGVLILREDAVIRFTDEQEFKEVERILRKKYQEIKNR